MAQEMKAYNVVATANVNPEVVDSLGCEEFAAYDADEVDAVLAEKDAEIAKLNAENERLKKCEIFMKQHFYCEEVIACESAKNRRLKRALWIARAERAKERKWHFDNLSYLGISACTINFQSARTSMKCRIKKAYEWAGIFENVESKCRAKAEEYK